MRTQGCQTNFAPGSAFLQRGPAGRTKLVIFPQSKCGLFEGNLGLSLVSWTQSIN